MYFIFCAKMMSAMIVSACNSCTLPWFVRFMFVQ